MNINLEQIDQLVQQPQESLAVEVKTWIDPSLDENVAKIVKTALALRNHNGGYIVIGFNNKTMQPDMEQVPPDVRKSFHLDIIQSMIAKYASEPFQITIEYPQKDGQEFPVIIVPSGVKTPVAAKKDLFGDDKAKLICTDTVYVRSLSANNTPSTTQARWKDWNRVVEVCFDNREADVGRFIRRHLGSLPTEQLRMIASIFADSLRPRLSTDEMLKEYIEESETFFVHALRKRNLNVPERGASEVGLIFIGDVPEHSANHKFLNLLSASNPHYTGWPVWLDTKTFEDKESHPQVIKGVWEALIEGDPTRLDFERFDPKGKFYLYRVLQDDLELSTRSPVANTLLDYGLSIKFVAEVIAVGIAFAKAMECVSETTTLAFAFKWIGLEGRYLSTWATEDKFIPHVHQSYGNESISTVNVPLETPLSAIAQYVYLAVHPLFELFNGYDSSVNEVEELTQELLDRKRKRS